MIINPWNEDTYNQFIDYLNEVKDQKYKEFHESLVVNSKYEILGVRLPVMRNIAKEISKTNIEDFLKVVKNNYYEEVIIEGLVISHIKDEEIFYKYFNRYIDKIDNWALCDTFCNSIKLVRKYKDKYFDIALSLSLENNEYRSRVGLIMILSHFVEDKYADKILSTIDKIKIDYYYNNMAIAWLLCDMYIKQKEKTIKYLRNNNLNVFTMNKTISKINDSYRVTKEEKDYLKTLRRKK